MNKLWIILIAGILLRIFLAFSTMHSDIQHFDLAGTVLQKGHILDFYDYTFQTDPKDPIRKNYPLHLFNYPPAVYFTIGSFSVITSVFTDAAFHNDFLFNIKETLGDIRLNIHLLLLKIPYLIFDLLIAFFLYKFFSTKREKLIAFSFWMFNPINLYSTYMMGQFDIIPTFFVVAALYSVSKTSGTISLNKMIFAGLLLGIGGAFKIYPLLLLLPLAFLKKDLKSIVLTVGAGILTYILIILPFLTSEGFRSTALVANQTLKSFYPQIAISGGESIILFPLFIFFFYFVFLHSNLERENLWQSFFIILLIFFIFTHYHPQWFLWLTPFLIIELIRSNFKHIVQVSLALFSFLGAVSFFEPSLSIGLFSPLFPYLYDLPMIWTLLGLNLDHNFSRSIIQTLFVSIAVYFIYYYFPEKSAS